MVADTDEGGLYYLDIEAVITLYAVVMGCTDQEAADQIRNRPGLESALARPANYAHYYSADLALQAAALVHGIAEGQHFIEGNKRLAFVAMHTFLGLNGYQLTAPQEICAAWILELSAGGVVEEVVG